MVDEGEQTVGCADDHIMGGCFYCLWQVQSSAASQTDNSIWVSAQLELDASEIMATWIAEVCSHFVFESDEPTDPKVQCSNPGHQAVQVSAGGAVQPLPFTNSQTAYLEQLGKGNTLCIWEGAALVKQVAGQQPAHSRPPQGPLQPIFLFLLFSSGNWGQQRISYNCLPGPPPCWPQIPSGSKHLTKLGGAEVGMSSCQFPGKGNAWIQKSLLLAERNEQPSLISSCS